MFSRAGLSRLASIARRPRIVLALLPAAALLLLASADPPLYESLKLKGFDIEERIAPRLQRDDLPVAVVAIDEASLAPPYGQWPWPRLLMARLVTRIAAAKPAALGVDILFAEPDRYSPGNLAANLPDLPRSVRDALSALPDSDAALGAAVRDVPTVLGMGPSFEDAKPGEPRLRLAPIRVNGPDPRAHIPEFSSLLRDLPVIAASASGSAGLAEDPALDGIVRRMPQLIVVGGNLVPGFAAETLRVATGSRGLSVAAGRNGVEGLAAGAYPIPTDAEGRAYPYFAAPQSTPTLSAAEVLGDKFDSDALSGRMVLLGVTGLGLVDVKSTPVGLMQGIEVHAQLLQSILSGETLRRPGLVPWAEAAILILVTLVAVFALPYQRPARAGLFATAIVLLLAGGEFALFRLAHLLVDAAYPALGSLGAFAIMAVAQHQATEAALRREREARARIEGELSAARTIQMGLLPRPLPRVPETSMIEVHALIETARLVGGDLYDFVMLDPRRLFFTIADVSGKGVDAAMFMAVTKTVLSGASVQHGEALDRVFADSNAKIATESDHIRAEGGRPMFVTVFAGVLELDSGTVWYASAGHDSAYLLRAGETAARLDTEGGPPLGAMDDFPFPVDRIALRPGDLLLLYTDGVTEAKDESGAFYTSARLDRVAATIDPASARGAVDAVREDLRRFVGAAEQADDITLLAVRWQGPVSAP